NYLGILELVGLFDAFLSEHLKRYGNCGRGNTSYLSSTNCEEIIDMMGEKLINTILEEIKLAKYYTISVYSTPDLCHIDQLSFTVRYVFSDEPAERFLKFVPILFDCVTTD
ncbi:Uncharacterized protein APZ42_000278, partial [Daphnia magna]